MLVTLLNPSLVAGDVDMSDAEVMLGVVAVDWLCDPVRPAPLGVIGMSVATDVGEPLASVVLIYDVLYAELVVAIAVTVGPDGVLAGVADTLAEVSD
jgi:hypothetical protein